MFLLFNEEKNRFRKRNQFIAIEQNFPTKAVVCVHVSVVGTERMQRFNAPIKSQRHKSINRLGVQLKFRTYVFIYIHVVKMLWLICRAILWRTFTIFSYIEAFFFSQNDWVKATTWEHSNVTSQFEYWVPRPLFYLSLFFLYFVDTRNHVRE